MLSRHLKRDPTRLVGVVGRYSRYFSNAPNNAGTTNVVTNKEEEETMTMTEQKRQLVKAALIQVPKYGWTQDAITAAVLEDPKMTISMSGLLTPTELINSFMEDFNHQLRHDVEKQNWSIYDKVKWRLEQVIPFVQSGQWHKGMAKGIQTPYTTHRQLHEFIEIISPPNSSIFYQTALGGIFIASELHLLTDSSKDYQDTWKFLETRLYELENNNIPSIDLSVVGSLTGSSIPSAAYTAVASSLLDGIASLVLPSPSKNAMTNTNTTTIPGTNPDDYKPKSNK